MWLLIGLLVGAAAVLVAVRPRLRSLSARGDARRRARTRARSGPARSSSTSAPWRQERLAAITDAAGAVVGLVQGAERRRAAGEHDAALRARPGTAAGRAGRGQGRPRQAPAGGRAARRAAKEQLGRVDAQLLRARPGAPRVARAPRGAAEDAGRDRRAAAHRDRRAGHRAAQAERARAVGPDAAAQRGRAGRHGPLLRLRRADPGGRRRGGAAPGPGGQPAGRQARGGRRQGAAPGRARRLPGPRRGGAPAAPARPRAAAAPARQGAGRQGLLGRARLRARLRRDVPARASTCTGPRSRPIRR